MICGLTPEKIAYKKEVDDFSAQLRRSGREIARTLGTETVVEGSTLRSRVQIRVWQAANLDTPTHYSVSSPQNFEDYAGLLDNKQTWKLH